MCDRELVSHFWVSGMLEFLLGGKLFKLLRHHSGERGRK